MNSVTRRVLVQFSYAIGVAEPLSIFVDSYGTSEKSDSQLTEIVRKNFDLKVSKYDELCRNSQTCS